SPEDPPPPPPPATVDADEPPPPNSWFDIFDWLLRLLFGLGLVCKRACHYAFKRKTSSRRVDLATQDTETESAAPPPPGNSTMRMITSTPRRHIPPPQIYERPRIIRPRPARSTASNPTSSHASRASSWNPPHPTESIMDRRRTVSAANPFGALEILGLVGLAIRILFLAKDIISSVRNIMSNGSPSSIAISEEDTIFAMALQTPLPDDNEDDYNPVPDNDDSAPAATIAVEFTPVIVQSTAPSSDQDFELALQTPLPGDTDAFDDSPVVEVSPTVVDSKTTDTLLDLALRTSLPADCEDDWDLSLSIPLPEDDGDAFDDLVIACDIPLPADEDDDFVEDDEHDLGIALSTPLPDDGDDDWDLSMCIPLPEDDGDAFDDFSIALSTPLPENGDDDFVEDDENDLVIALSTPLPDDGDDDWDISLCIPLPEDDGDAFDEFSIAISTPLPENGDDDLEEDEDDDLGIALSTPLPDDGDDDWNLSLWIPLPEDDENGDDDLEEDDEDDLSLALLTPLPEDDEDDWDPSLWIPLPEDDGDAFDELSIALSTPLPPDEDDDFMEERYHDQDVGERTLLRMEEEEENLVEDDEEVFIYIPSLKDQDDEDGDFIEDHDHDQDVGVSALVGRDDGGGLVDDDDDVFIYAPSSKDQDDRLEELADIQSSPASIKSTAPAILEFPSILKPVQEGASITEPDRPVVDDPFAFPSPPETAQDRRLHAAAPAFVPRHRATPLTPHRPPDHARQTPTAMPRVQHPLPMRPWEPPTPTPIPTLQRSFAPPPGVMFTPIVPMWGAIPPLSPMGHVPPFPSPPIPPVFVPAPGYPAMPMVSPLHYNPYVSPAGLPSSSREAPAGLVNRPESPPRPIPIIRPSASFDELDQMERDREWRERIESRERERNQNWENLQEERRLRHEENEEWKRIRIEQRAARRAAREASGLLPARDQRTPEEIKRDQHEKLQRRWKARCERKGLIYYGPRDDTRTAQEGQGELDSDTTTPIAGPSQISPVVPSAT
ncbi:hypothetical protein H0H93_003307, partial [Arthromyces matolae]